MQVERFAIEGPLLLTPGCSTIGGAPFRELESTSTRGSLGSGARTVHRFCRDNHCRSAWVVLRGLHYQLLHEPPGNLLMRCVAVQFFDVAVDLRLISPTFGQWCRIGLSGTNHQQLLGRVGFAHGCLTLSETADVLCRSSD
jgi:dTDP-4-dehydrorhamnose 3,5-epimerase